MILLTLLLLLFILLSSRLKVEILSSRVIHFSHEDDEDTNITKRRKEEDLSRLSKTKLQDLESQSLGKILRLEAVSVELEKLPRTKPNTHRDSRLSEVFSPGRERLTWEGEIMGYTGGFSLERELARLSEKGSTERVNSWAILENSRLSEGWLA
ncbi:hypothetical protein Lal_00000659 [Lupinus albus]|nr:hypothetical protein Lal_00000659 [Lupinus albus]